MKTRRWIALLAIPALLAGCEAEDEAGEQEIGIDEQVGIDVPETPGMGEDTMGMGMGATTISMTALNGSGITGQAEVTPRDARTQVMVRLTGATEGVHAGHIHQGTCDAPGAVVVPLQEITVAAGGTGEMTTTVDVDPATAMNGQHIIAYHEAGGSPGRPVVCGAIPMHDMGGMGGDTTSM